MDYSKTYEELITIPTYEDRLIYLLLYGSVAEDTFGYRRYLNQVLYKCPEWRQVRRDVIIRDQACDLAFEGYEIPERVIVHHINPIRIDDVLWRRPNVFDPSNLVCTVLRTHEIIHYGSIEDVRNQTLIERQPNDTSPWR